MNNAHPLPLHYDPTIGWHMFIDNSLGMDKLTCPTEWNYANNMRLTPVGTKAALNFGQAIHSGLATRYKLSGSKAVTPAVWLTMQSSITEHFLTSPQPDGEYRDLTLATNLLSGYNKAYGDETFTIVEGKTGPHVEHSFAHLLHKFTGLAVIMPDGSLVSEITVFYIGRIDLIVKDESGNTLITDHKTSSVYGQTFWDEMHMTPQFPGYAWAFRETYGVKPWGVMIDAIRIRKPTKKDAQEAEYTGADFSFRRDDFVRDLWPISDERIDEWKENSIALLDEGLYFAQKGYYPMRTNQCVRKFGHCPFYNVCSVPRDSRDAMLSSGEFVKNEWSPLNKVSQPSK